MTALMFSNVSKRLSKNPIVSELDFRIESGEFVFLLGPIGSGKTTILNLASGLLEPDCGQISVFSQSYATHGSFIRERINFASSTSRLNGYSSVYENLLTFCRLYAIPNPAQKINEVIALLEPIRHIPPTRKVYGLSAGESALINLYKSLLNSPKLLFLDEITSHFDPVLTKAVLRLLRTLNRKRGMTILYATQQIRDMHRTGNRVIVMKKGMISHNRRVRIKKSYDRYYA